MDNKVNGSYESLNLLFIWGLIENLQYFIFNGRISLYS